MVLCVRLGLVAGQLDGCRVRQHGDRPTVLSVAGTGELYTWGWGKSGSASVMRKSRGGEGRAGQGRAEAPGMREDLTEELSLEQG